MSWRPAKGKADHVECTRHRQVFQIGEVCALCTPADADTDDKVTEASALAIEAARLKLPSILKHEQNWNRLAHKLEKLADDCDDGMKVKLYDAAIKAARQATSLCQWREDWIRIERSERLAIGESGAESDVAPADSPSSEVH